MHVGAARADFPHGFDEIDAVIVMLLNPRCHGEHIGVEDDVLGREADPGQQLVGPLANLDLAVLGVGLALLVEGHDDHRRAIVHALARLVQERAFAFLHRDRIDDRLARNALQPGFDHLPLGAVDHHRNPGNIRLGGDQLKEGGHGVDRIEQPLIHVHVDHLRAVLNLLTRDFNRLSIVARQDQLLERGRAGDIGALANIDEAGRGLSGHGIRLPSQRVQDRQGGSPHQAAEFCAAAGPQRPWQSRRYGPGWSRSSRPAR